MPPSGVVAAAAIPVCNSMMQEKDLLPTFSVPEKLFESESENSDSEAVSSSVWEAGGKQRGWEAEEGVGEAHVSVETCALRGAGFVSAAACLQLSSVLGPYSILGLTCENRNSAIS